MMFYETDADRHQLTVYLGVTGRPMVLLEEAVAKLDAKDERSARLERSLDDAELEIAAFEQSRDALREAKEWIECFLAKHHAAEAGEDN